jgi:hypothetical protein
MNCSLQKTAGTGLRAGSRPQAFKSNVNSSRTVAFAPARPAVQKLAVQCQAGVWSERLGCGSLNCLAKCFQKNILLGAHLLRYHWQAVQGQADSIPVAAAVAAVVAATVDFLAPGLIWAYSSSRGRGS